MADFLTIVIFREILVGLLGMASSLASTLASGVQPPQCSPNARQALAKRYSRNFEIVRKSAIGPFLITDNVWRQC